MPDKRDSRVDWDRDPARARCIDSVRTALKYDEATGRDDLVMITVEKLLDLAMEFGERAWDRSKRDQASNAIRRIMCAEGCAEGSADE